MNILKTFWFTLFNLLHSTITLFFVNQFVQINVYQQLRISHCVYSDKQHGLVSEIAPTTHSYLKEMHLLWQTVFDGDKILISIKY